MVLPPAFGIVFLLVPFAWAIGVLSLILAVGYRTAMWFNRTEKATWRVQVRHPAWPWREDMLTAAGIRYRDSYWSFFQIFLVCLGVLVAFALADLILGGLAVRPV